MYDEILTRLKSQYEKEYGFAIFDLWVEREGEADGLRLCGQVLLEAQRRAAEEELRRATGLRVESDVTVLADPDAHAERGWGLAAAEIVDVWRVPPPFLAGSSEEAQDKNRNTQVTAQDNPFRILTDKSDWYLIQLDDLSLGWAAQGEVRHCSDQHEGYWADIRRPQKGGLVDPEGGWVKAIAEVARRYEGTPYLWGGTTKEGIDCSGLVQRVYRESCGVVLPRHSGDQRKVGLRVPFPWRTLGDILVLTLKERRALHVGLCLDEDGETVIHACRRRKMVVIEELNHTLENYALIGVRRIVNLKAGGKVRAAP